MSEYFCAWKNYRTLINEYREAEKQNDVQRMVYLKHKLHDLCQKCGVIPTPEIKRIIKEYLPPETVEQIPYVIERMIDNGNTETARNLTDYAMMLFKKLEPKKITYRLPDFQKYEVQEDGSLKLPEPEPVERVTLPQNINFVEQHLEQTLPDTCSEECPFSRHCSAYPQNVGEPCIKKWKFKRNEPHKLKEPAFRSQHGFNPTPKDTVEQPQILEKGWNQF